MTDRRTVFAVVLALALLAGIGMCGLIYLVNGRVPASGIAVVAGPTGVAIGALSTLLASTKTTEQPQQVIGPEGGPVPTADVEPDEKPKRR